MRTLIVALAVLVSVAPAQSKYVKDVESACKQIKRACGPLLTQKKIDWKKITRQFTKEARAVETDGEHLVLLQRLIARVQDGHAYVKLTDRTRDIRHPMAGKELTGPGMFLCRVKNRIYVKNAFATARKAGIKPGMELLSVNGTPAKKWLAAEIARHRDVRSFSTDTQAFFHATHRGFLQEVGTRHKYKLKTPRGKTTTKTVVFSRGNQAPWGPAVWPPDTKGGKDVRWGRSPAGFGYIHLRGCPQDLPERIDPALKDLADTKGLILDFRANRGGAFDHEAFFCRFIKKKFGPRKTAGPHPYSGKMVVIIDGLTASAGETGSGMFKEWGRAYVIGESSTAGMSSSKTTLKLPSGLFELYVSTRTNMRSFNGRRGVEGIGIAPHEIVEYSPKDLADGVDTLIKKADKLLKKFPAKKVKYKGT